MKEIKDLIRFCLHWWPVHVSVGIVIVGVFGPIAYWALDPSVRLPVTFGPATVYPDTAGPNGRVMVYYEVTVNNPSCVFFISRAVIDAANITFPSTAVRMADRPPGKQQLALTMVIPADAAAGPMKMDNSMYWACNPFQQAFHPEHPLPPLMVVITR